MAPPVTWITAELVTASRMNAEIRDRFNSLATRAIVLSLGDPDGPPLTTGVKSLFYEVPYGIRPTGWTIFGDVAGSIVLDVLRKPFATAPPVGTDSIAGSEKPTLVAVQKAQDLALGSWSDINSGDIIGLEIESVTTLKAASVTIRGTQLDFV